MAARGREFIATGLRASGGIAAGPILIMPRIGRPADVAQPAHIEIQSLSRAIGATAEWLEKLLNRTPGEESDILRFQIELLKDDLLFRSAARKIEGGKSSADAWRDTLDKEMEDYRSAPDEYFRARASDLQDIRDRVLAALLGYPFDLPAPAGSIIVGEDLGPSVFLALDWSSGGGIALTGGSAASHVAILARARNVPMVVNLGVDLAGIAEGSIGILDADHGTVHVNPPEPTYDYILSDARKLAGSQEINTRENTSCGRTKDGVDILVDVNVTTLSDMEGSSSKSCSGVGLVRTEFLLSNGYQIVDEETEFGIYCRLMEWAAGKTVTIRTLDGGADKPLPGLKHDKEKNPSLGRRGIRLSLANPERFLGQLRAVCRAAVRGPARIMLPMVTAPEEFEIARSHLDDVCQSLERRGVEHRRPPLGMMVETPAAAITVDLFPADFFSIGTNDLTQYVMAATRDDADLATLNDPCQPAVLRLVKQVIDHARQSGRCVSLCGDAATEPSFLRNVLHMGLRRLSVPPERLDHVKTIIETVDLAGKSA